MNEPTKTLLALIACIAFVAVTAFVFRGHFRQEETQPEAKVEDPKEEATPEFERVLEVTNSTFLLIKGTAVVRVTDEEWAILTNAFPKHIVHAPMIFDRVK